MYEAKHQYLMNKRERVGLNHYNDPKAFIEYLNDTQDVYKNIEDMINDKKLNPVVTGLFIRDKKLNMFIVSITRS